MCLCVCVLVCLYCNGDFMKKVLLATWVLRDRWIVVIERVYTASTFFMKSAVCMVTVNFSNSKNRTLKKIGPVQCFDFSLVVFQLYAVLLTLTLNVILGRSTMKLDTCWKKIMSQNCYLGYPNIQKCMCLDIGQVSIIQIKSNISDMWWIHYLYLLYYK